MAGLRAHPGLLQGPQGAGHFLRVACRIDLVEACRDAAVRRDDESAAAGKAHHAQIQQAVVRRGRLSVGVGQQRKRQLVFAGEIGMRAGVVDADPDHRRVEIAQHADVVAKAAGLLGAARRVVPGVEIQHQPAPGVIAQAMGLAVLVRQGEVRRRAAFRPLRARPQHPQHRTRHQQQRRQSAQHQFQHVCSPDAHHSGGRAAAR